MSFLQVTDAEELQIRRSIAECDDLTLIAAEYLKTIELYHHFSGAIIAAVNLDATFLVYRAIKLPEKFRDIRDTYTGHQIDIEHFKKDYNAFLENGALIHRDNINNYSEELRQRFLRWEMEEALFIPLFYNEDYYGQIILFTSINKIDQASIKSCKQITRIFEKDIVRLSHFYDLYKKETSLKSLEKEKNEFLQFISKINTLSTPDEKYKVVAKQFLKKYPFDMAGIYLIDDGMLQVKAITSSEKKYENISRNVYEYWRQNSYQLKQSEGAPAHALLNESVIYIKDVQKIKHQPMSEKDKRSLECYPDLKSVLHITIKGGGASLGVLSLWSMSKIIELSDADMELIEHIASNIGVAITNAELFALVEGQKEEVNAALKELELTKNQLLETEKYKSKAMKIARDAAEASARVKSEFLASMSHEIRTPMNAIIGLVELMQRTDLRGKQSDYINKIEQSTKKLLGLINDILDISKIEAGKLELEQTDFNLYTEIENTIGIFKSQAENNGIELNVTISKAVPEFVNGDSLRFCQILTNLVSNAIKFTNQGMVKIEAELQSKTANCNKVLVKVIDSGCGIQKETIPLLFEQFTQESSSTTRNFGGTGLGLNICKKLVEIMNGEISVESEVGKGSEFKFSVQFNKALHECEPNSSKPKILALAGINLKKEFLEKCISNINADFKIVNSGNELIESFGYQEKYQIIISDSEISDIKLAEMLRRLFSTKAIDSQQVVIFGKTELEQSIIKKGVIIKENTQITEKVICEEIERQLEKSNSEEKKQEWDLSGIFVLLVEDNEINQQVAQEILESEGINVEIASNGLEAIDAMKSKEYHAILMDLQMPEMGGVEATKIIRKTGWGKNIPIIAMTANVMQRDRQRCFDAGMDQFIEKPIEPNKIFTLLEKEIAEKSNHIIRESIENKEKNEEQKNQEITVDLKLLEPEINIEEALPKMLGNEELLLSLLREFYESHGQSIEKILEHIKQEEIEKAIRLAHTIKGLAGTFSAKELAEAAREVESTLEQGSEEEIINKKIEVLKCAHEAVKESIARIM